SALDVILPVAFDGPPDLPPNHVPVFGVDIFEDASNRSIERPGGETEDRLHVFRPTDLTCSQVPIPCPDIGGLQIEAEPLLAFAGNRLGALFSCNAAKIKR